MPILYAVFLSLMSSLLTAIPLTPGGLGPVELFLIIALPLLELTRELAASVLLIFRFISFWSTILFGFIFFIFARPFDF